MDYPDCPDNGPMDVTTLWLRDGNVSEDEVAQFVLYPRWLVMDDGRPLGALVWNPGKYEVKSLQGDVLLTFNGPKTPPDTGRAVRAKARALQRLRAIHSR